MELLFIPNVLKLVFSIKGENYMNNKQKKNTSLVLYAFMGASIGAVFGLVAYVKDWI